MSDNQNEALFAFYENCNRYETQPSLDNDLRAKIFPSDKLVTLDRDKAEFFCQLRRATNARRIVEIGTLLRHLDALSCGRRPRQHPCLRW
jgi:predicted O-methyltransferase YrrM